MLEGATADATVLAKLAAEARVNVNVLMFDTPRGLASSGRMSETNSEDRDLREHGLETLASRSRGSLFRIVASPLYVFQRLSSEISGHYMLGVEPTDKDRDGKAHQIKVQVRRQGTAVRARQQFQYAVRSPGTWSRDVLMGKVLRSPSSNTQLPMRMTTYVYKDAAAGKVKLVMAAEIDPVAGDGALDIAMGFALYNDSGRLVASGQERKIYSPNTDLPILYDLTMAIDSGSYRLRLAAIDLAGNSGSVERDVQAWKMDDQEIAVDDLLLSPAHGLKTGDIRPPVTLKIQDGQLATYTELYTNKPGALEDTKVVFELADNAEGPTLRSDVGEIRARPDGTYRQAMAIMPVGALPPGPYVARAIISTSGKTVGKLTRPFIVAPGTRTATQRKEAAAKRINGWKPLGYFAALAVGGIALFIPGPWLASYLFHYDYSASFLIFTALVNIHHFILDGAIWKLRDGRIASLLLNSKQEIAYVTRNARDRATSGPSRARKYSPAFGYRAVRNGTVARRRRLRTAEWLPRRVFGLVPDPPDRQGRTCTN